MNTVSHNLHSMMEAAVMEGKEDAFIRAVFDIACTVMWFKMDPETKKFVDWSNQQIRQHLEGKVDIWKRGEAAQ